MKHIEQVDNAKHVARENITKYIAQENNKYLPIDTDSGFYALLEALPEKQRPTLLDATDAGVVAYFEAELKKEEVAKQRIENKKYALAKLAKAAGLTEEELAALR